MPKSALSPRLLDADNWKGTDDDVWYMRWRIKLKYLFAYGPRATEWWARWREFPKTFFAIKAKDGYFRIETETWERDSSRDCAYDARVLRNENMFYVENQGVTTMIAPGYLSRIQYYTRWSFQIQWPLMVAFHWYWKAADVPKWGEPRPNTDGKLVFGYFGAHRDGDKVYWFPSAFLGRVWK